MNVGIAETLIEASKLKSRKAKLEFFRKNNSPEIKEVLLGTYNPNLKWLLPEGAPPFKKTEKRQDLQSVMKRDLRRFYVFIDCEKSKGISKIKREQLFIEMLESFDPDDAELLIMIKNKKLAYNGLTYNFVKELYPNETAGWPDAK